MIPWTPRPAYKLEDLNKQQIDGQFYQEELTPVSVSKETVFKSDKIIDTRVRHGIKKHKVRWLGYGQSSTVGSKRPPLGKFETLI